jgi:hypothetical protein
VSSNQLAIQNTRVAKFPSNCIGVNVNAAELFRNRAIILTAQASQTHLVDAQKLKLPVEMAD